jgi:hypothetical protein
VDNRSSFANRSAHMISAATLLKIALATLTGAAMLYAL